jgi:hypothetical protein
MAKKKTKKRKARKDFTQNALSIVERLIGGKVVTSSHRRSRGVRKRKK